MRRSNKILSAIAALLSIAAVLTLAASAGADLVNGSFESSPALTGWTTSAADATIGIQNNGDAWTPCTVTFNSGSYSQAVIWLCIFNNPVGHCWFDNLVPSGFTIDNPSFEQHTGNSMTGWNQDSAGSLTWWSTAELYPGCTGSVLFYDPTSTTSEIRMWQTVNVTPNTNYSYTFDVYMEDDFRRRNPDRRVQHRRDLSHGRHAAFYLHR